MDYKTAERLASLRRERGFSQEALGEKLGVSRQAISKWERAESSPDTDNLIALAKLYGITLDELLNAPTGNAEATTEVPTATTESTSTTNDEAEHVHAETIDPDDFTSRSGAAYAGFPFSSDHGFNVEDDKNKVHIGFDGVHVTPKVDGADEVHVGWSGVHVKEGKADGNEVHVDGKGVQVGDKHYNTWQEAHEAHGHDHNDDGHKYLAPVGLIGIVVYLLYATMTGGWDAAIYLTGALFVIELVFNIVWRATHKSKKLFAKQKSLLHVIPMFWATLTLFFYLGFYQDAWHPGWIVFVAFVAWEAFVGAIDHAKRR